MERQLYLQVRQTYQQYRILLQFMQRVITQDLLFERQLRYFYKDGYTDTQF